MSNSVLSHDQVGQYFQNGYLLVSGLIPDGISAKAEQAMWRSLDLDSNHPKGWEGMGFVHNSNDPDLVACYTPELISAAAQLSGDDASTLRTPSRAHTLNAFPKSSEWYLPNPHIDHSIKKDGYKTFPRAFRIASMIYLGDVKKHGGGTFVWPRSHHNIRALAESDPEKYGYMWVLGGDIQKVDLGEPIEMTPNHGDVLFYHFLCAHSGSTNVNDRPRFAVHFKW